VTVQLDELGKDLRDFITDATLQIDKHIETKFTELLKATKDLVEPVKSAFHELPPPAGPETTNYSSPNYKQALLCPPPLADL
jgi:hypothetical protein